MKVFISWSGELSNKIGEKFRTWLPSVLQAVRPYYTPADIEKGTRWETSLSKELECSEVGVFLITNENLSSHWMLFEAGALAKKLEKSRVCPILFGVEHTNLPAPMRSFQTTPFKEEEIRKFVLDTNKALGEHKLSEAVVNDTFEVWWPRLKKDIDEILENYDSGEEGPKFNQTEAIKEILELSRLTSRRAGATGINPRALAHVFDAFTKTHNLVKNRTAYEEIMESLKEASDPLRYIARRTRGDGISEVIKEFENLTFEVDEQFDILDEEPPF